MKIHHSILSLLLLAAYVLLLAHDFIPHSHQHSQEANQTTALVGHGHGHDDHDDHNHHHKNEPDKRQSDDLATTVKDLSQETPRFSTHSHFANDPHYHELNYSPFSKDKNKIVPPLLTTWQHSSALWRGSHWQKVSGAWPFPPSCLLSSLYLSGGTGLRAPPALS